MAQFPSFPTSGQFRILEIFKVHSSNTLPFSSNIPNTRNNELKAPVEKCFGEQEGKVKIKAILGHTPVVLRPHSLLPG
jgi:hypothetical protein